MTLRWIFVVDESSSLLWFSFRAKVGTNFDPGARFFFLRLLSRGTYMMTIPITSQNFVFIYLYLLPAILVIH